MNKKLYVGNLPYSTDDLLLKSLFETEGFAVESASVMKDRETGRSRGFGFVELQSADQVAAAVSKMNGKDAQGRPLIVNEAREKGARPDGPGGGFRPRPPREGFTPRGPSLPSYPTFDPTAAPDTGNSGRGQRRVKDKDRDRRKRGGGDDDWS